MADSVKDITSLLGNNGQQHKNTVAVGYSDQLGEQWLSPLLFDEVDKIPSINLINDEREDIITQYAIALSKSIQFPANTAFFHALGCIASAMNKSFSYDYYGSVAPVTLYCVSAQPPSTGKSAVNSALTVPIRLSYKDFNKEQARKRAEIEIKIKAAKKEYKLQDDQGNSQAMYEIATEIANLQEQLDATPIYKYSVSNSTPEALEKIAFSQGGIFNVISDEAGSILTMLGAVYSDKGKPGNADLVLQGWDGDYMSSARITRDSAEGFVRGCVSVIAQDETIKTILSEGERGNGVSERFLLMREHNLLGMRDHFKERTDNAFLKHRYTELVRGLVFSEPMTFKFDQKAMDFIKGKKQELEPLLSDGGKYSNSMLRGAIGKMDKQVFKISCILHAAENFSGGSAPVMIKESTVKWAYEIYSELAKMYEVAAESQGYAGDMAEINTVLEKLRFFADKNKYQIKKRQLRDVLRNLKIFRGRSMTKLLDDKLLPKCESLHYIKQHGELIFINPGL